MTTGGRCGNDWLNAVKWRYLVFGLVFLAVLAVLLLAVFGVWVCRDWAFVCEHTGSRKGYRQWRLGLKTGHWTRKSPLEAFVASQEPGAIVHQWTSYAGTGKSLLGLSVSYGHGRPGPVFRLDHDIQRAWIEKNDAATVRALYDLLVSGNEAEIEERVIAVCNEILGDEEEESPRRD